MVRRDYSERCTDSTELWTVFSTGPIPGCWGQRNESTESVCSVGAGMMLGLRRKKFSGS